MDWDIQKTRAFQFIIVCDELNSIILSTFRWWQNTGYVQNKTTDEGRNISPSNNLEHIYTRLPLPKIKFSVLHIAASNPVVGDQNRKVCGPGAQWLLLTLRWLLQLSHSCVSSFLKLILMLALMTNEIMEASRRKWWRVSANTHCKCFCGDEKSVGVMYYNCVFASPCGFSHLP